MNCMRINCAHDGEEAWAGMIRNLRLAEQETGMRSKIEMDVAGPKLRTGPVEPGPAVPKYHPQRDAFGRIEKPAPIRPDVRGPSRGPTRLRRRLHSRTGPPVGGPRTRRLHLLHRHPRRARR